MNLSKDLTPRQVLIVELSFILLFSILPLLVELPYRVNVFLTWEGAYRMHLGQVPFRDFGMPMGYGFWILPFFFFKIFGPYVFTLVITQCFINIISLITFRALLKMFGLSPVQILISVTVMCLSFVMVNFWPWYNHTVFVYELIGIYFLVRYLLRDQRIVFLVLSSFFIALTFVTKQDAGGLGLMLSLALIIGMGIAERKFKPLLYFVLLYAVFMAILIGPYLRYDFSYWFNYGQAPHFSRLNAYDFLSTIFEESLWLKFYIAATVIICIIRFKSFKGIIADKSQFLFALLTLGILAQAMIIQITSFSPPTTNFYFHSFAIAFLAYHAGSVVPFEKLWVAVVVLLLVFFWRSENYWKYSTRVLSKFLPFSPPPSNVVSKNTWSSKIDQVDSIRSRPVEWGKSNLKSMKRIRLPLETSAGIERIGNLAVVKGNTNLRCLNMSNLTPLALDYPYTPTAGKDFPLWYHKGVAFFDRETEMLCKKVDAKEYDLILFEVMPDVDSFFPMAVRECMQENYEKVDSFISPTGYQTDYVEVYVLKQAATAPAP